LQSRLTGRTEEDLHIMKPYLPTFLGRLAVATAISPLFAPAQGQPPVNLGSTAHFTILAGAAITQPTAGGIIRIISGGQRMACNTLTQW
jgi:hypothetical protein